MCAKFSSLTLEQDRLFHIIMSKDRYSHERSLSKTQTYYFPLLTPFESKFVSTRVEKMVKSIKYNDNKIKSRPRMPHSRIPYNDEYNEINIGMVRYTDIKPSNKIDNIQIKRKRKYPQITLNVLPYLSNNSTIIPKTTSDDNRLKMFKYMIQHKINNVPKIWFLVTDNNIHIDDLDQIINLNYSVGLPYVHSKNYKPDQTHFNIWRREYPISISKLFDNKKIVVFDKIINDNENSVDQNDINELVQYFDENDRYITYTHADKYHCTSGTFNHSLDERSDIIIIIKSGQNNLTNSHQIIDYLSLYYNLDKLKKHISPFVICLKSNKIPIGI
jgi:hypothetical protein